MKRIIRRAWLFLLLLALCGIASAAPPTRDANAAPRFGVAMLAGAAPQGRWVLVLLDPRRRHSTAFVEAMKPLAYDGMQAVVAYVGAKDVRRDDAFWPRATAVDDASRDVVRSLRASGTPLVVGIDVDGRIAWREAGVPDEPARLASRIAGWVSTPPTSSNP